MSKVGPFHETRSTTKTNQRRAAINQAMSDDKTPAWAKHLLTEFASLKTSFDTKMTEVTNSIKGLKKDIKDLTNRISDAKTRIETLETDTKSNSEKLKPLT